MLATAKQEMNKLTQACGWNWFNVCPKSRYRSVLGGTGADMRQIVLPAKWPVTQLPEEKSSSLSLPFPRFFQVCRPDNRPTRRQDGREKKSSTKRNARFTWPYTLGFTPAPSFTSCRDHENTAYSYVYIIIYVQPSSSCFRRSSGTSQSGREMQVWPGVMSTPGVPMTQNTQPASLSLSLFLYLTHCTWQLRYN